MEAYLKWLNSKKYLLRAWQINTLPSVVKVLSTAIHDFNLEPSEDTTDATLTKENWSMLYEL